MEVRNLKKRKLRKKSALNSSLVKAIPLSVALTLFASGTAFGSEFAGTDWLAVDFGDGEVQNFNVEYLQDAHYRNLVHGRLQDAWESSDFIYLNDTECGVYVDFSSNASMERTLDQVLEVSEARGDVWEAPCDGGVIPY